MSTSVTVVDWGIAGALVDEGRPGRAWLGASRGGAVDLDALRLANRLVGNEPGLAAIETSGALTITLEVDALVVVTGAVARVTAGDTDIGWGSPAVVRSGTTIEVVRLLDGARSYLAVRGGLVALDERHLTVGSDPRTPVATMNGVPRHRTSLVRLWPGPRLDRLAAGAWDDLCARPYTVDTTSRVGVRLRGTALEHRTSDELRSEGVVEGAVQVPPDGSPIVMLADHPTTGGYPVVGVVDPADLWQFAQAAPGEQLRFVAASRAR